MLDCYNAGVIRFTVCFKELYVLYCYNAGIIRFTVCFKELYVLYCYNAGIIRFTVCFKELYVLYCYNAGVIRFTVCFKELYVLYCYNAGVIRLTVCFRVGSARSLDYGWSPLRFPLIWTPTRKCSLSVSRLWHAILWYVKCEHAGTLPFSSMLQVMVH